ncbi:MAG: hypothetical protein K1X72_28595 [Pyrinomonadaceae bacterium]|nr:hypothetical protein [Pyrinomonadaceae bacterium]
MPLFSIALIVWYEIYPQLALWATNMPQSLIAETVLFRKAVYSFAFVSFVPFAAISLSFTSNKS